MQSGVNILTPVVGVHDDDRVVCEPGGFELRERLADEESDGESNTSEMGEREREREREKAGEKKKRERGGGV